MKLMITVVLLATLNFDRSNSQCPPGWNHYPGVGNCIKLFHEQKSHSDAQTQCRKENALLVMPKTKAEQDALDKALQGYDGDYIWIGGNDPQEDGKWKWVDGKTVTGWTNWKSGQLPEDPSDGEYCMKVKYGPWLDYFCDKLYKFVCQILILDVKLTKSQTGKSVTPFTDLTLNCSVKQPPKGITYKFYKDNKVVQSNQSDVMILQSVGFKDSDVYACEVAGLGIISSKDSQDVFIDEIPTFTLNPDENQITPGTTVTMTCTLKTIVPSMEFSFYYKGEKLQTRNINILRLLSVEFESSGDYRCDVLYNNRRSALSNKRTIFISACPIPTGDDDYTERLLASITPREETTRWGKGKTEKRSQKEDEHDEL